MRHIRSLVIGTSFAVLGGIGFAQAETTIVWKSQGMSTIALENVPMADGTTAQAFKTKYIETLVDGEWKGQTFGGECVGLGFVDAAGVYSGHAHCTVTASADDAWTIDYHDTAEGGDWVVTGGKGKFKGATGKGHTTYTWGDAVFGDKITMAADGTITLP